MSDFVTKMYERHGVVDYDETSSEDHVLRAKTGRCLCCNKSLHEEPDEAIFLTTSSGLIGGYCSGLCLDDLTVIAWLQEKFDDIISTVKFRAGIVDADGPEEE